MAENKIKLVTKIQTFEDVQRSLQSVEKTLNKLSEAINKKAETERKETEGKSGDTKTINEGTNAGNDYSFEVKTDKGWQSPILRPHYDSGWKNATKDANYNFKHNLNSQMLLVQVYLKLDTGEILYLSHIGKSEAYNDPDDKDTGITVQMVDGNTISIGTAKYYITDAFQIPFDNYGWEPIADGYLRLLIWKTGLTR